MSNSDKFNKAIQLFDEANMADPNKEIVEGIKYSKELLYSIRMTDTLNRFSPNSSEALKLAVHCQHICRWEIPRNSYETGREGYLKWRKDLKDFHAKKASNILSDIGYVEDIITNVKFLLLKKAIKEKHRNPNVGRCCLLSIFGILFFTIFRKIS